MTLHVNLFSSTGEYGNIQTANFSTLVNCPLPRLRTENRKTTQVLTEANNKHTIKKTTNPDKQKAESGKHQRIPRGPTTRKQRVTTAM